MRLTVFCLFLLLTSPAFAAESEVRAVALQNGCKPTKIEVTTQRVGSVGETSYTATCENKVPAASGSTAEAKTLRIRCQGHLCVAAN